MTKFAVMMSHELWKDLMTTGHRWEWFECESGLPEDAVLAGSFTREHGLYLPDPVFIFESLSWSPPENCPTLPTPWGQIPLVTPVFRSKYHSSEESTYTLRYSDRGLVRTMRLQEVGSCQISLDWQPDWAEGSPDLIPLDPLPYTVEELT